MKLSISAWNGAKGSTEIQQKTGNNEDCPSANVHKWLCFKQTGLLQMSVLKASLAFSRALHHEYGKR